MTYVQQIVSILNFYTRYLEMENKVRELTQAISCHELKLLQV